MRLGTVTLSATLSVALLSGCSFIGGQSSNYNNPYAQQSAAQYGQYGQQMSSQRCQISAPTQPIPRGCRAEQVTIGTTGQGQYGMYGAQGGFPQQPQFGQPQYTDGGYGNAVGQTAALGSQKSGSKKKKPKLRGSLSLGVDRSLAGDFFDFDVRTDLAPAHGYDPQNYSETFIEGSEAQGEVRQVFYTANEQLSPGNVNSTGIRSGSGYEVAHQKELSFDDVWSTPASIQAGVEYILNDNTTVFANGGYTAATGNSRNVATIDASLYREELVQAYGPAVDAAGNEIPNVHVTSGAPSISITQNPNREIAAFSYDFTDLEQYDLELGARRYFDPIFKSEGYRTVTPFVGASVGVSHVNDVDFTSTQTQNIYSEGFGTEVSDAAGYNVVQSSPTTTRLYEAQWIPQGQLNVGAEWQLTPGFAIAAETGVRLQNGRDYADFTDASGNFVEGYKADVNISVPVTLRGSVNF